MNMRLPFELGDPKLEENARVKFIYTSPELHQNIEISLDGNETTVEALFDAFQRFLGALGICAPENAVVAFVEVDEEEDNDDNDDDDNNKNDKPKNKKS